MTNIRKSILSCYRGFIFDIDGTMINSMKVHLEAWQTTLERHGRSLTIKEIGELAHGINPEIVRRIMGDHLSEEQVDAISNEKEELFRNLFDPEKDVIKGFIHFIDLLKKSNLPIVIGTAAPPENVAFFMERLGIGHYFEGVVHEDDVSKGKPSPEVFLKAAKIINVPIQECVVFEDSPSGAEASANAGSYTVAVLSTKSTSDFKDISNVVTFIHDYTDLLEKGDA